MVVFGTLSFVFFILIFIFCRLSYACTTSVKGLRVAPSRISKIFGCLSITSIFICFIMMYGCGAIDAHQYREYLERFLLENGKTAKIVDIYLHKGGHRLDTTKTIIIAQWKTGVRKQIMSGGLTLITGDLVEIGLFDCGGWTFTPPWKLRATNKVNNW